MISSHTLTNRRRRSLQVIAFAMAATIAVRGAGGQPSLDPCSRLEPSETLVQAIPDIVDLLKIRTTRDGIWLFEQLLVKHDSGCSVSFELRADLGQSDYRFVLCQLTRELPWNDLNRESKQMVLGAIIEILAQTDLAPSIVSSVASQALRDPDPLLRCMAIKSLTMEESEKNARQIANCLDDTDESVRKKALRALQELESPYAIPPLLQQLESPDHLRRFYAIQNLVKLNARVSASKIEALIEDPHANIRYWAIWALYHFEYRKICGRLHTMVVQGKEDDSFNTFALAACAKWGESWPIPFIMERLKRYPDRRMGRLLIELQVSSLVPSIIDVLDDPTVLGGETGSNANSLAALMQLLAKLDPSKAVPVLRKHAQNSNSFLATRSAQVLGDIGSGEAVPDLLPLLDNRKTGYSALMALAKIARPDTVPAILARIRDKRTETTWQALGYIARAADEAQYKRLTGPCEFVLPDGSLASWIQGLNDQCGLRITVSRAIPAEFLGRQLQERQYASPMQVLDQMFLGVLNYGSARYSYFLEHGAVHIGTIEETLAFWDRWVDRP